MDFLNAMDDNVRVVSRPTTSSFATKPIMINKPATAAVVESPAAIETEAQRFDRVLSRAEFKTLKAVLDNLGKGAAGACVQNLNVMMGWPETQGLV